MDMEAKTSPLPFSPVNWRAIQRHTHLSVCRMETKSMLDGSLVLFCSPAVSMHMKHTIPVQDCPDCHTFLTVRLPVLHVEQAIPKRLLTGSTDKATGVPSLSQGMHHFLQNKQTNKQKSPAEQPALQLPPGEQTQGRDALNSSLLHQLIPLFKRNNYDKNWAPFGKEEEIGLQAF